ncbi:MAG: TetR family transcriptional regulator [Gammaproteobacteria bacterium]|nr:MAG: TetR family transcriptional regulator [Gammaproteobacteria bacterium]
MHRHIAGKAGYHHGNLRAQLVEASRQLVEEKGPDHFSVSEACRVAGVSTAAPYKHFRDKADMLKAVALGGLAREQAQMQAALAENSAEGHERIKALGRVYIRFACEEPGVFRLLFGSFGANADDPELTEKGEANYALLQQEVMRGLGRQTVDAEVEKRSLMLWSFVHGLAFLMIDGKVEQDTAAGDLDVLLDEVSRRMMG